MACGDFPWREVSTGPESYHRQMIRSRAFPSPLLQFNVLIGMNNYA